MSWQQHDLKGGRQLAALDAIEADFDNVRAAWRFATDEGDVEALDQMVDSLYWFCAMRGRMDDALALYDYAKTNLPVPTDGAPPRLLRRMLGEDPRLRPAQLHAELKQAKAYAIQFEDQAELARVMGAEAVLLQTEHKNEQAIPLFKEALSLYEEQGARFEQIEILRYLGRSYHRIDDWERSTAARQQGLALSRELGDVYLRALLLFDLGTGHWLRGEFDAAASYLDEAEPLLRQIGNRLFLTMTLSTQAHIAFERAQFDRAEVLATEALTIIPDDDREERPYLLAVLAMVACMREEYEVAWAHGQAALKAASYPDGRSMAHGVLCMAACGRGAWRQARQHLRNMQTEEMLRPPVGVPSGLPMAAIIEAQTGDPTRAVELLGLAFHNPLTSNAWLEAWPLLGRADLEARLGAAAFAAAWERGAHLEAGEALKRG